MMLRHKHKRIMWALQSLLVYQEAGPASHLAESVLCLGSQLERLLRGHEELLQKWEWDQKMTNGYIVAEGQALKSNLLCQY
jgi:hypothetical protein